MESNPQKRKHVSSIEKKQKDVPETSILIDPTISIMHSSGGIPDFFYKYDYSKPQNTDDILKVAKNNLSEIRRKFSDPNYILSINNNGVNEEYKILKKINISHIKNVYKAVRLNDNTIVNIFTPSSTKDVEDFYHEIYTLKLIEKDNKTKCINKICPIYYDVYEPILITKYFKGKEFNNFVHNSIFLYDESTSKDNILKINEHNLFGFKKYFKPNYVLNFFDIKIKILNKITQGGFKIAYKALLINNNIESEVVIFIPLNNYRINHFVNHEIPKLSTYLKKFENKCVEDIICPIYLNSYGPIIITNYFKGQELKEFIKKNKYIVDDSIDSVDGLLDIMLKISIAVEKLHNKGIVHSDLKPNNILINNDNKNICIIDLGISCETPNCKGLSGTDIYFPPEILISIFTHEKIDINCIKNDKNQKSRDIWSLGCIFYEMLMSETLFSSTFINNLRNKDKSFIANNISKRLKLKINKNIPMNQILLKMLDVDCANRISIEDVIFYLILEKELN